MKTQTIILSLLLIPIISFAQGNWTYFSKKDGLVSDKVYGSLADQRGNVWFLTHKGMSRFDGTEWFNYNSAELKMKDKFQTFEDRNSNIWFWPNWYAQGVAMFDGNNFSYPSEEGVLSCDNIQVITEDSRGRVWIGGRNGWLKGRIDVFDGKKFHNYNFNGVITNLFKDTNGNMWINTQTSNSSIKTTVSGNYITTSSSISHSGLISKYDCDASLLISDVDNGLPLNTRSGLPNTTIVFEDSNGNIWFNGYILHTEIVGSSAHSVLLKYNGQDWKYYRNGIKGIIYRLEEDNKNNIWAFSKKGTYIFDGTKWKFAWGIRKINSLVKADNGAIWIGMDVGIGRYENGKWKYFRKSDGFGGVNVIFKDSKGNIWFGGENVYLFKNNEWVIENGKPGLKKLSDVSNIIEDKAGNIWISTEKKGVVRYTE